MRKLHRDDGSFVPPATPRPADTVGHPVGNARIAQIPTLYCSQYNIVVPDLQEQMKKIFGAPALLIFAPGCVTMIAIKERTGRDSMQQIEGKILDEERALYAVHDACVSHCRFEGAADGESALKEAGDLTVQDCVFALRYPLWHVINADVRRVQMYDTCRAALWYCHDVRIADSDLFGIKAMRECRDITLQSCRIRNAEFGWFCRDVYLSDCEMEGEYFLLHSENITMERVHLRGKYSFQYCKNVTIRECVLDTKDAFWETENVTVYDSVVNGEYLAWYAKGLRLVNCRISGTQPLCYAQGVVMENCTMNGCDLSFEYSEVQAHIKGHIDSVKNPLAGSHIHADSIGQILLDAHRRDGGRAVIGTGASE